MTVWFKSHCNGVQLFIRSLICNIRALSNTKPETVRLWLTMMPDISIRFISYLHQLRKKPTSWRGSYSGWAVAPATSQICLAVEEKPLSCHCKLVRDRNTVKGRNHQMASVRIQTMCLLSVVVTLKQHYTYMERSAAVSQHDAGFVLQLPGCFLAWPSEKPPDSWTHRRPETPTWGTLQWCCCSNEKVFLMAIFYLSLA